MRGTFKGWDSKHRFTGRLEVFDHVEGVEMQVGVAIWAGGGEAGVSMNDARGGTVETLLMNDRMGVWVMTMLMALIRRKAYRRTLETAAPNYRPALTRRKHDGQVKCVPCLGSGYQTAGDQMVTCAVCEGRGWMDPVPHSSRADELHLLRGLSA